MKKLNILLIITLCFQVYAQEYNSILGQVDFNTFLKSVPELKSTTDAAFEYANNNDINFQGTSQLDLDYDNFKQKMELYANQLQKSFEEKTREFYGKNGNEDVYNTSKQEVNQNELIQQMGGVDNIMKMSEKERELAAKKALVSINSSSALSPFSEAQMQRMMNDPEYAEQMAAQYNNMTEKKKADLVKNKLETNGIEVSNEELEKRLKQRQTVKNTMDVNRFVDKLSSRLSNALMTYNSKRDELRKSIGNHDELNTAYREQFNKIPLVIMGEGKVPDPKMEQDLKLEFALKHKKRAASELSLVQIEFKKLVNTINESITDYYSYLNTNGFMVNGNMNDVYDGTNTELALGQLEMTIGESIGKIAEISFEENSLASGFELDYKYISHK